MKFKAGEYALMMVRVVGSDDSPQLGEVAVVEPVSADRRPMTGERIYISEDALVTTKDMTARMMAQL